MARTRRRSGLPVYPAVDLNANARAALAGARYHLQRIHAEISTMMNAPGSHQANVNTLHWHLRAFFWELVATMDTLDTIVQPGRSSSRATRNSEIRGLEEAKQSDWWREVLEFRNFAHRAFIFLQCEVHADGRLRHLVLPIIPPSGRQHPVPARLEDYIDEMTDLQRRILPPV